MARNTPPGMGTALIRDELEVFVIKPLNHSEHKPSKNFFNGSFLP